MNQRKELEKIKRLLKRSHSYKEEGFEGLYSGHSWCHWGSNGVVEGMRFEDFAKVEFKSLI